MIDELKKRYDDQPIEAIEGQAKSKQETSESSRREFIEALYYLRHTKRWRENAQYSGATFDAYLRGKFMMAEAKFDKERQAYICFPDATEKFGAGVVNRAIRKIGSIKAGRVLNRLPRNTRIERIDEEVAKLEPVKKEITFSGPTKPDLQAEVLRLKAIIHEKDVLIASQQRQIERLKNTVKTFKRRTPVETWLPARHGVESVGVSF